MKVAVIWARFGAYHLARLRGAAALAAKLDAQVVGIEIAQKDHYDWDVQTDAEGFERITVFPNTSYDELTSLQIRQEITSTFNDIQPDVVAINGWGTPEARAAIAWCKKHPAVKAILMSETKQDDGKDGRRIWWKELVKSRLVNRCDAALVGGRPHAEYLQKLGFPQEKIFLGYDVVDNDYFARESSRIRSDEADTRLKYQLPEHYFFICTRFLPRKNIAGLLRAYADYRAQCDNPWGLVIAGSGEEQESLRQQEQELGVDEVHWPGFVQYDDMPAYFGLASAFIHPALAEPWGLVVNEAAACSLPILVSETVGSRYELVKDGENGILFDPKSQAAMTAAMLRMSGLSDEERAAMGKRSFEIVSEWGPERFGRGLFAAINEAVKGER